MVTQKDIAERVGVSVSLVSHVLGGRGEKIGAASETIRRIRLEATRQGYQPSAAALALRGKASRTLGVVVRNFDDPYLGHLVGELQRLAHETGYALLLTGCKPGPKHVPAVDPLMRFPLDGVILVGSDVDGAWFEPFVRQKLLGVQIGAGRQIPGMIRLTVDDAWGVGLLVEHLVKLGHRHIAFAGYDPGIHNYRRRLFDAALKVHGLSLMEIPTFEAPDKPALDRALSASADLLGRSVSAVVGADDEAAMLVIHAAHRQGLRVPRDLSVTGMDDIVFTSLMSPSVTTVRPPLEAMVQEAFALLMDSAPIDRRTSPMHTFRAELVVRESTAAPRKSVRA